MAPSPTGQDGALQQGPWTGDPSVFRDKVQGGGCARGI